MARAWLPNRGHEPGGSPLPRSLARGRRTLVAGAVSLALGVLAHGILAPGHARAQGFLDNAAQAVGTTTGGAQVRSGDSARVQLVPPRRELNAVCDATLDDRDGTPGMSAGDAVLGRVSLANAATVPLADVLVSGAGGRIAARTSGDDGDGLLENGETWLYELRATITQDVIDTNGGGTGLVTLAGTAAAAGATAVPFTCELPVDRRPGLDLLKIADDGGLADTPPTIAYTLTATNTGNVTLRDVVLRDEKLSPPERTCPVIPVGGQCVERGTYAPTRADFVANRVENRATASAADIGGAILSAAGTASVVLVEPNTIRLAKAGSPGRVRRGETVTFSLTVTNDAARPRGGVRIVDDLPPGLSLREGTVAVDGLRVPARAEGRRVTVGPLRVGARSSAVLTFQATVNAQAQPGGLVNRAEAVDARTDLSLATARARVEIVAEPVLDCADVIGRVFVDANRNGVQDEGERGVPEARVVTVRGLVVTADEFGRFSIPCASLPRSAIGSNFVLKLDEESLPRGSSVLTENPRVVRLTAGRTARVFFGVAALRDVEVQVTGAAFLLGHDDLAPDWRAQLDGLVDVLRQDRSALRLTYRGSVAERELAERRLRTLERTVSILWQRAGAPYELEIERRAILE